MQVNTHEWSRIECPKVPTAIISFGDATETPLKEEVSHVVIEPIRAFVRQRNRHESLRSHNWLAMAITWPNLVVGQTCGKDIALKQHHIGR